LDNFSAAAVGGVSIQFRENEMNERVAIGFDLEPLANGNLLIEFFGDDGKAFNTQVVTREVIEGMPAVVALTLLCIDQGTEVVKKIMEGSDRSAESVMDKETMKSCGPGSISFRPRNQAKE
jgi:hypothetical protein